MSTWTVIQVEWARLWRNKLRRLALASFLLIPLLYSSLYLWAFWDPYGSLDKLPVALVNEDAGGTQDGKTVNFGKDLQKTLFTDKDLDWHVVSHADAIDGLSGNKYYTVLDIPRSFTADILSAGTDHPRKADLLFTPNQGRNYLAGQITNRVQGEIASSLAANLSQTYIQRLLDVVGTSANGMSQIVQAADKLAASGHSVADGAKQVADAAASAARGSAALDGGLQQLEPASSQIANGLAQVQQGTTQVQDALQKSTTAIGQIRTQITPLASPTGQLVTGTSQVSDAVSQLSKASDQLATSVKQAAQGAAQIRDGASAEKSSITQLQSGLSQALSLLQAYQQDAGTSADPRVVQAISVLQSENTGLNNLAAALGQTAQGADQLSAALNQLESGQTSLANGLQQLGDSTASLKQGTQQFQQQLSPLGTALAQVQAGLTTASTGLSNVQSAQSTLHDGAEKLNTGIAQSTSGNHHLATGINALKSGADSLAMGAAQLADGQSTFAGKVGDAAKAGHLTQPDLNAEMMSHPINALTQAMNPVKQYGPGLTPYFVPLSLWVGALMLYFLLPLREGRWRVTPVSHRAVMLGKFSVLWTIGVLQSAIASSVLLCGLGLTVTNVPLFYLFNMLLSVSYITVIGMFVFLLGTGPGRLIGIILLLLQLTSSGGTFPTELVPSFFQALKPVLPMTYGVNGLRNIVAINDLTSLGHSVLTTAGYLLVALLIILLARDGKLVPKRLRKPDTLVA